MPHMIIKSFLEQFLLLFRPEPFRQLARTALWSKRKGKIDPFDFLISLLFGQMSALRLTLDSQAQSLAEPVSRQGIDQRYTPEAVAFLKASFDHVLVQTLDWSRVRSQTEALRKHFSAVHLVDTTGFDCPDSLQASFPSCGGAGSAANVKVLLRYEILSGALQPMELLAGKRSDQGLALRTAEYLQKNELQINDKGFFDSAAWRLAQARGAYLLMPLTRSVSLWTSSGLDQPEEELDLAGQLKARQEVRVEWPEVFVGQKGKHRAGPLRLVAFRLSPESAGRHRSGLREAMRTKGRTPTAEALELAGWLLLVTNAPPEKLPSAMLSYLYRMRWQVELIFRQAKSVLRLDQTLSENPSRVQCEIWARLLCAVVLFLWHANLNAQCWARFQCEASFEKVIVTMRQWGHTIARAFLKEPDELLQDLRTLWRHLLKQGPKGRQKSRTNTWDALLDLWLEPKSPKSKA
jgi:hypothetical protein